MHAEPPELIVQLVSGKMVLENQPCGDEVGNHSLDGRTIDAGRQSLQFLQLLP